MPLDNLSPAQMEALEQLVDMVTDRFVQKTDPVFKAAVSSALREVLAVAQQQGFQAPVQGMPALPGSVGKPVLYQVKRADGAVEMNSVPQLLAEVRDRLDYLIRLSLHSMDVDPEELAGEPQRRKRAGRG